MKYTWLLLGLCMWGCIARSAPQDPNAKTFTFRIQGEPETLDWNRAHTPVETYVLMNLMEGLVSFDSGFKVVPALAQSWAVSNDKKTYIFKLRKGVKWSDGVPLKAQDFVFSWKRLLSPVTAAPYAYLLFDIVGAEEFNSGKTLDFGTVGIKALDDLTFEVKLKRAVAYWLNIPTFWVTFPLRQDIVDKYGAGWETPGRMVTVGPYILSSHDIDSKIVLKPNPHYYGERGNLDQIVGQIIKDDATALTLYESGKLDFLTDISTIDLTRLAGRSDLKTYPYLKTGYIGFSVNKFPVNQVKVRRAIAMAIDRDKIKEILHGGQSAASSFVPPPLLGHSLHTGIRFDPLEAKAELRRSGVDLTKALSLDLLLVNFDKPMILAQFIQGQLKKNLGISVSIQPFDHKTFRAQLDLSTYPLFENSWSADYPDPDNFMSIFQSDSGINKTLWKNKTYDDLVLKARGLNDPRAREKLYLQAQKLLQEDEVVILPLYYEPNIALIRARVTGLELSPLNYLLLRKVNVGP